MFPLLQVNQLKISFPNSDFCLQPIDFTINEGEIISIIGESGSGKSTLARALMCFNAPNAIQSGEVILQGQNLYDLSDKKLRDIRGKLCSIAFQNSKELLNPRMKIKEQIKEILKRQKSQESIESRLCRLIETVNLGADILEQYPHQLSGGMIQRILLLMAIALNPPLVILDEPTSALDVESRDTIIQLLHKIHKLHNTAFLIITHDFYIAQQLSHKTMVLYQGHLAEVAPTQQLLESPLHPYTHGLIHASMDIFPYRDIWGIREPTESEGTVNGCPFYSRCPQGIPICKIQKPKLLPHIDKKQQFVACNRNGIIQILKAQNITKAFHKRTILKNINLSIHASEVVAIIGSSGSGKSTLANILGGYLYADQGQILFENSPADFKTLLKTKYGIQMIFQDPDSALNPQMTIQAAVAEPLFIQNKKTDYTEHVKTLLKDVGLPYDKNFLERKIETLSGGQKQRVSIARALILEPRLLIADEITSMLDTSTKANLLRMLKGLQNQRGLSILFITHDLICAKKIADSIYQLTSEHLEKLKIL